MRETVSWRERECVKGKRRVDEDVRYICMQRGVRDECKEVVRMGDEGKTGL